MTEDIKVTSITEHSNNTFIDGREKVISEDTSKSLLRQAGHAATVIRENEQTDGQKDEQRFLKDDLTQVVDDVNETFRHLEFNYDEENGRVQIKVLTGDGEIIREIPTDEFLSVVKKIKDLNGIIFEKLI